VELVRTQEVAVNSGDLRGLPLRAFCIALAGNRHLPAALLGSDCGRAVKVSPHGHCVPPWV
jgi:hypothetical protein